MSESIIENLFYIFIGGLILIFLYQLYLVTISELSKTVKATILAGIIIGGLQSKGIFSEVFDFIENISFSTPSIEPINLIGIIFIGFFIFIFIINLMSLMRR